MCATIFSFFFFFFVFFGGNDEEMMTLVKIKSTINLDRESREKKTGQSFSFVIQINNNIIIT